MNIKKERILQLLSYDENTGHFIRKVSLSNRTKIGDRAGTISETRSGKRYIYLSVDGFRVAAHRLALFLKNGEWPLEVDHIDGNGLNNKLNNLREAGSRLENMKNVRRLKANTSGSTGVCWDKKNKKWFAFINVDKKMIFLGRHATIEQAKMARKNAEVKYGFHVNHGSERPLWSLNND